MRQAAGSRTLGMLAAGFRTLGILAVCWFPDAGDSGCLLVPGRWMENFFPSGVPSAKSKKF